MSGQLVAEDMEIALWHWAKNTPAIADTVNGQIHFKIPSKTPPFPLITLSRVGGGPSSSEALLDFPAISFSCWGKPDDRASTARSAAALRTAAFNLYRTPTVIELPTAHVTLHGAEVGGAIWLPDPSTNEARHVVDIVFTTTSVAV